MSNEVDDLGIPETPPLKRDCTHQVHQLIAASVDSDYGYSTFRNAYMICNTATGRGTAIRVDYFNAIILDLCVCIMILLTHLFQCTLFFSLSKMYLVPSVPSSWFTPASLDRGTVPVLDSSSCTLLILH